MEIVLLLFIFVYVLGTPHSECTINPNRWSLAKAPKGPSPRFEPESGGGRVNNLTKPYPYEIEKMSPQNVDSQSLVHVSLMS